MERAEDAPVVPLIGAVKEATKLGDTGHRSNHGSLGRATFSEFSCAEEKLCAPRWQ